jgi:hypothetical protein
VAPGGDGHEAVPESGRRRKTFLVLGLVPIVAGVVLAVLLVSGMIGESEDPTASAKARLQAPFDAEMRRRDTFFESERRYVEAMKDADTKTRTHRKEVAAYQAEVKRIDQEFADEFDACNKYIDVECPTPEYPDYPKVPDLNPEARALRSAASGFQELSARLTSVSLPGELTVLHAQLTKATDEIQSDAEHNADVLDETIVDGEGGRSFNREKIKTLHRDSGIAAIKQMNIAAMRLIKALGLSQAGYDVPGGRDLDPADHSHTV